MAYDPTDPDTKAALAAAVDEATNGLKAKVEEVIADNKKLKTDLRAKSEINPADLEKVEAENEKLRADLAAAQKTAKDATTLAEKATKTLEAEQGVTHRLIAENGLVAELTKAGVTDPAYLDAVKALHLSQVKVIAEGDERKAMYGDKPLADAIKEWAGSDVGKRFVAAPVNGGGGAPGGKGGQDGGKTMTRAEYNERAVSDPAGTNTFLRDGGKVVDAAA